MAVSVDKQTSGQEVLLRNFPYPYQAALTLCSDIDGTRTRAQFLSIQQFLNTSIETAAGPGLGLEIGNSFFPYTTHGDFSLFNGQPGDQECIEELIRTGYIDCIHSFGDPATSRAQAVLALDELSHAGCFLKVWVDHARAASNLGKDTTCGSGDLPDAAAYHADLTLAYGVRFIWQGRGSSIIGQGIPHSVAGYGAILDQNHLAATTVNMAKELVKSTLASVGNRRFALHAGNRLLRVAVLADGQCVYEFQRSNPHWQGLSFGHDSLGLAYVLRPAHLQRLVRSAGTMIVYTHLGIGCSESPYLSPSTIQALQELARSNQRGEIYVTTTARLLEYQLSRDFLDWTWQQPGRDEIHIHIHGRRDRLFPTSVLSPQELQGLTFYIPDRTRVRLWLSNEEYSGLIRNSPDHTGRSSVMFPFCPLMFPYPDGALSKPERKFI